MRSGALSTSKGSAIYYDGDDFCKLIASSNKSCSDSAICVDVDTITCDLNVRDMTFPMPIIFKGDFKVKVSFTYCCFEGPVSFADCKFEKSVDFSDSRFKKHAGFTNCSFDGVAIFSRSHFSDQVFFSGAVFGQSADFQLVQYDNLVSFANVKFEGNVLFHGAKFKSATSVPEFSAVVFDKFFSLGSVKFKVFPDFRSAKFNVPPLLAGLVFPFDLKVGRKVRSVDDNVPDDASNIDSSHVNAEMIRALRKISELTGDHELQAKLFGAELKYRRRESGLGYSKHVVIMLYGALSDFGLSISRPIYCSAASFIFFALLFAQQSNKGLCDIKSLFYAGVLSLSQLIPVLNFAKDAKASLIIYLYGEGPDKLSAGMHLTMALENFLGILFIFLLGLALRNNFKL